MHVELHIKTAKYLTYMLENRFKIFGVRFGLDPILGLAPWVGDIISALLAFYIVWLGIRLRVPEEKISQMIRNILIDFAVGLIPVVGDVSDFIIRSNSRNLDIVLKYRRDFVEGDVVMKKTFQVV